MMHIAVSGMVGCGKSTLATALAERFSLHYVAESVGATNPWLTPFYSDPPRSMKDYALPLQLHMLRTRVTGLREMLEQGGQWVSDQLLDADALVFAKGHHEAGLLSDDEWALYLGVYEELLRAPACAPPSVLVYLEAPLDEVMARIQRRGRPDERDTPAAYWAGLHARFARWHATYTRSPIITLDVRRYDVVANPACLDDVANQIAAVIGEPLGLPLVPASRG